MSSKLKTIGHNVEIGKIDLTKLGIVERVKDEKYFTIVRNPYQRFISAYNYLMCDGTRSKLDLSYKSILASMSLDDFIDKLIDYKEQIIHFVPQHYFINGDISICKFESLEKDLNKLGIYNISHRNKTRIKYITLLTPEQKSKIYSIYKLDFETFNYDK